MKNLFHVPFLLLVFFLFFSGCSSRTVNPEDFSSKNDTTDYLFFLNVEYDTYGRPNFEDPLTLRPTQSGVVYYIVQYNNHLATSYFLIKTSETHGQYANAMNIIYSDTFSGLKGGWQFTQGALGSSNSGGSVESQAVYAAIVLGAPLVGAVGGFLYGVVHSGGEFMVQVNESVFVDYKEDMVLYTSLKYDDKNRLIYLHEYDNFKKNVYSRKYEYLSLGENPCRVRHKITGEETLYLEEDSCLDIKPEVF